MLKKILTLAVGFSLFTLPAQAFWIKDTATASAQNFRPALDESLYITTYGSQTLQKWQFRSGLFFNYSRRPLEIGTVGVSIKTTVRDLAWVDAFGSIGITDWLQIGLDVPAAFETYLDPSVAVPATENVYAVGDVSLEAKIRLLDIDRYNVGLALRPYVTAPTGNGDKFIGNNHFTGGGDLIADFDIADRFQMAVNLGYLTRPNYVVTGRNIRIDDQFRYAVGASFKAMDRLSLVAEAYGATTIADFFDRDRPRELPLEVDGGLKFFPIDTLTVTVGGGAGLTYGYGAPLYRAFVGIAYTRPQQVELELSPEPIVEEPTAPPPDPNALAYIDQQQIVIKGKVHFEFNKAELSEVSAPILTAVVDLMNASPQITLVQVEGHTDSIGAPETNQYLSQTRAEAVRQWLIGHGVATERLVAKGMGEEFPIETNETAVGRAINRRVAFTILNQN